MTSRVPSCGFVPLAPKPQEFQDTLQHSEHSIISLGKVVRKAKNSTKSAEEWDVNRMLIHDLYMIHDLSLLEVIKIMENEHSFSQSCVVPFCAWCFAGHQTYQLSQTETVY